MEYAYNPPENQNPAIKAVVETDTLSGRYFTDWGTQASRRDITQKWPVMDAAFFEALLAKSLLPGTLAYIEDDGTLYTVIVYPPTYDRKTPGGEAYMGVTLKMNVVSSP
jgi:hypothetical protein